MKGESGVQLTMSAAIRVLHIAAIQLGKKRRSSRAAPKCKGSDANCDVGSAATTRRQRHSAATCLKRFSVRNAKKSKKKAFHSEKILSVSFRFRFRFLLQLRENRRLVNVAPRTNKTAEATQKSIKKCVLRSIVYIYVIDKANR